MSSVDDFPDDMEGFPFDERDREAVFGASGADVPASLSDVADLVCAARRPGSADELVAGDVIVAGIAAAIGEHAAPPARGADERISVLNKYRTAKVAVAATAVLMLGGTAAAAATGTLPAPVSHHHADLTAADMTTGPSGPTGATGPTGPTGEHHRHHGLVGDVASVNGSTDPSACGSGDTGTFTVTGHHDQTYTVNVSSTTTYSDKDVTDPSFANVCVGTRVKVKGMLDTDGSTVEADKVRIKQPHQHHEHQRTGAFGQIASVNGSTDPSACGTGDTGSFTLNDKLGNTFTVNVTPTTTFAENDNPTPTFTNVCVGGLAFAKGAVTDTTVAADSVFLLPPRPPEPPVQEQKHGVFGQVASVNGSSDPSACGTGDTGSFTLTDRDGTVFTVNVTSATQYNGWHHDQSSTSFADVCVGKNVGVKGDVTDTTVAADSVFVVFDHDFDHGFGHHHGHHHGDFGFDGKLGDHHHGDHNKVDNVSFRSGSQNDGSHHGNCDHGGRSGDNGSGSQD